MNDKSLREKITRMYSLAYPTLHHVNPNLAGNSHHSRAVVEGLPAAKPPQLTRHIRVAFVSDFLMEHSVGKMTTRLISSLPRTLFHVSVLRFLGPSDWVQRVVDKAADEVVKLPESQSPSSLIQWVVVFAC